MLFSGGGVFVGTAQSGTNAAAPRFLAFFKADSRTRRYFVSQIGGTLSMLVLFILYNGTQLE